MRPQLAGVLVLLPALLPLTSVPGREVVTAQSAWDSTPSKTAQAVCPPGKNVVGLGGTAGTFQPGVVMTGMYPDATLTSVTVTGHEDESATSASWYVTAHAVCADPLPGLELATAATTYSSFAQKKLYVSCPTGKVVLAIGVHIDGAQGEVLANYVTAYPTSEPQPNRVLVRALEDDTGAAGNWSLGGYAICADPPPGYELVTYQSPTGSPPVQPLSVPACPTGRRVLGVSALTAGGAGEVSLRAMVPGNSAVSVFAMEDHDGTGNNWYVKSRAVCALP